MRIKAECISEDAGGYVGQRGQVNYQQLALRDMDPVREARMVNTFDYRMSDAEKPLFAGKCLDKIVTIDVKDWEIFNARLKVKSGRIVEVQGVNGTK